jgi:zinc/manganese transport system permease protein
MFAGFMLGTWMVGTLAALVAGVVGVFVVLRGSAFAAHTLPLSAFPGAAAASLVGRSQILGMVLFAGVGVVGIARLPRRDDHDVGTALTLVTLLGLGALFLSLTNGYASEVYALLFGQVLGVGVRDLTVVAIMGAVAIAATAVFYRPLLLTSISSELAEAQGVSCEQMDVIFLILLALTTVMTLPIVGALLVFSLLVGPPAAARMLTKTPLHTVLLSVVLALLVTWLAIALSYLTNWPIGFFVGALGALAYGAGVAWSAWRGRSRRDVAGATRAI